MKSPSPTLSPLLRTVPALDVLRGYTAATFTHDLVAGLTVAAVAVPQAMAYATIAGIPPQHGLYTAIVMTAVGAIFDSSKQLINGPTNAISIATLSALAAFEKPDFVAAAIMLAFLVGAVQLFITLLRLGDLSRYISHAVIVGFTLGASALLVLDQLKNLLGLPAQGGPHDHFLKRFWLTIRQIEQTNLTALWIGLGTIAVCVVLRWLNVRLRWRLPEFLIAVIVMAAVVWYYGLDGVGKNLPPGKVAVIDEVPNHLPELKLPELRWDWLRDLSGSALAIALLGLLEAVAMAKAIAAQTKQKLDINQQCLSEAVANVAGSLFQCMPGSGSLTRSSINVQSGGRTQWSGVISAIAVALTMLLFAPYARYIPRAALAGILFMSSWRLVDWKQVGHYLRTTQFDATIVILTALAAVFVSVEFCVLIGVLLSFVLYVPKAARVHMTELVVTPDRVVRERVSTDPVCNRLRIYSLEGELFFGAAPELEEHLNYIAATADEGVKVVVLRLKRIRNPDTVCLEVLSHFVEQMRQIAVSVIFCGVRPDLMKVLVSSGLVKRVGSEHVFVFEETGAIWSATLEAIRFGYQTLGHNVCEHCPRRDQLATQSEDWHYMI
jgi:SulP family sulfate permease